MRVSVARFDLKKLTERIFEFEDVEGDSPEYAVMSQETLNVLNEYPKTYGKYVQIHTSPFIQGIPVAVCNAVPFGEVDLV